MPIFVFLLALLSPCVWAEQGPFQIRKGAERDIPEILEIDRANGGTLSESKLRSETQPLNMNYAVVLHDHKVVGFMTYAIAEKAIDLKRIAVAPAARSLGVAEKLAQTLLTRVSADGRTAVRAELPASQKAMAEALGRSQFEVVFEGDGKLRLEAAPQSRLIIDPKQIDFQTHYELLGVAENAKPDEIERAHDRRSAANQANPQVLTQLAQAREVLLSTERRAAYDETHVPDLTGLAERVRGNEGTPASRYNQRLYPQSHSLYNRLGVSPNATPELIASAYQRAVRQLYESFPAGNSRVERSQRSVDEAFAILGRPALRDAYDKLMTAPGGTSRDAIKAFLKQAPDELPSLGETLGFNTQAINAYDILGLTRTATPEEIRDRYLGLKGRYPDLDWKFPEVVSAYRILSNPSLRTYYDDHYPNLTTQGRREILHEMAVFEEKFLELAAQDQHNLEYGLSRPRHLAFETDGEREPAADPKTERTEPLLYRMLGTVRTASPEEIRRRYNDMRAARKNFPLQLAEGERAYLVLSNPHYRQQYDRTLSGMATIDVAKDREAAFTIMALAQVNEVVTKPGARGLDEFLGATSAHLGYLGDSAGIAKRYLQEMQASIARTPGPISENTFRLAVAATGAVGRHFPGTDWPEIRDLEQAVRGKLVARAIADSHDVSSRDRFLAAYLSDRAPDYLAARLRDARDALLNSNPTSSPHCDWSKMQNG